MLRISILTIGVTVAFLIGGCVCYLVNNDRSEPCYITFGVSISMCIAIVAFAIFVGIVKYCESTLAPSAISSGPILPLSSLPSNPSKILVSRRTP